MKKRILSFALTIVMLISVASVGVFNLTAGALTSGEFEYSVKSKKQPLKISKLQAKP